MRRRRPLPPEESSEEGTVNLTPLIDVVFVVLIMFIIIAPMLELDQIQLANGSKKEKKELAVVQENSPIMIHVTHDNIIKLNKKIVTEDELSFLLQNIKKQYPNRIPQLFHDKKAYFGTYQLVKNALELAGFEQLDVILQPD